MERIVHIIAIQEKYLDEITKQMKDVLGNHVAIRPTTLKELRTNMVKADDIVVLSHKMIRGLVNQFIPAECSCIIAKRDVNYANSRDLLNLPQGQKILVINDTKSNIEETVASLRETVFEHEYYSYNPDESIPNAIDYILTPGELDLLPGGLPQVIDIGSRLLDIETFYEIVNAIGMPYNPSQIVKRYIKSLVSLSVDKNVDTKTLNVRHTKDIRNIALYTFRDVIAVSESMKKTVHLAMEFARTPLSVHISGERGTGKGMLAQSIHQHSIHSNNPFISVNCTSKSAYMLEKELFGSEDGNTITVGAFEIANNGTVYLENVDELYIPIQLRILRAILEKEFQRVGGSKTIPLQVRLISCSKEELKNVKDNRKINDSFYEALTSLSLRVPSLMERREDIVPLIEDIKRKLNKEDIRFTTGAIDQLLMYNWPGNVTELYNTITYLSFLGEQTIEIEVLPLSIRKEENKFQYLRQPEINLREVIMKIEEHGFLEDSIEVLKVYENGKRERTSYGRLSLKKLLEKKGIFLTEQQLRMRMEVLQELGLLIIRQGRAGSTISRYGEEFLQLIGNTSS